MAKGFFNIDNIKKALVTRFAGDVIEELVDSKVKEEVSKYETSKVFDYLKMNTVQKAGGSGVVRFRRTALPFSDGSQYKEFPLSVTFSQLRAFADYYPVARACINRRITQITQLAWKIVPREITNETVQDKRLKKKSNEVRQILKYPTGTKTKSWTTWIKEILEDLLVIDAVAIYRLRNRKGDIIGYLPIDGATIELIIEKDGTTPLPPKKAYIQKIGGQEIAKLTTDELIYTMMNPRTHTPYGRSPLETLIIVVTTALKLQSYNLSYLTEGTVPSGFVFVPRDIASSRDQLKEWQEAWDAMLSGNPRFQQKLKFLPEGMQYEPVVKQSDMNFERFEKWLLLNTCAVFDVPPSDIGFTFDVNRSSEETAYEVGKERGLFPTALWVKELMDFIIQEDLGYKDLQFEWVNLNPTNRAEEARVVDTLINSGLMSIDEWRLGEGLEPTGAKDPFIMTPVGPIFVKDLAAQSESGQMPVLPYKPPTEASSRTNGSNGGGGSGNIPKTPPQAKQANERVEELRRWRRAALNDLKKGKKFRDFKTDILDYRTKKMIQDRLKMATTKSQVDRIFAPFIRVEHDNIGLVKLYEEINSILEEEEAGVSSEKKANSN